ncbi:MAG: hypothetical protein IJ339_04425, partial [Oscillospiraceae bacterium]|nr:hypothetical protein [Oscillospiraceae bacterium]
GQTIKLLGNITTSSSIEINKSITLDGGNYTIGGTASPLVKMNSAANITIQNATLSSTGNVVRWAYVSEGCTHSYLNCKISGGVYSIHYDSGKGNVVIEDCTLDGFNAFGGQLTLVTIKNTTVEAKASVYAGINLWGNAVVDNVTLVDNEDGKYVWLDAIKFAEITNSQAVVSGVTQPINEYVEASDGGFAVIDPVKNEEGKYIGGTVVGTVPENAVADGFIVGADGTVAEPDANNIRSEAELRAAIKAMTNASQELVIGKSFTVADTVLLDAGVLNLNGNTISAAETLSTKPVIRVLNNVTIKNGIIDGTTGINSYAVIVGQAIDGNLTIIDGTYKGITSAVSVTRGTLTVEGGEFYTAHDGEGTDYGAKYLLNCIDENYNNGTAKIVVKGGKFAGFNPSEAYVETVQPRNFVAAGKHVCADGSNYIVHGTTAVAETAATCTEAGTEAHYKCEAGKLFSDAAGTTVVTAESLVIPATGAHTAVKDAAVAAGCGTTGLTEGSHCDVCGEVLVAQQTVAATGKHNFGGWERVTNPTCTEKGQDKHTCGTCGHVEFCSVAVTGHSYGADGKCTACGNYDASKVVATPAPTVAPTQAPAATTAPTATPTPEATPEATPAPEMPTEADTTVTEVEATEEVVTAATETVVVSEGTATVDAAAVEKIVEATAEEETAVVIPVAQTTEEVVNKAEVDTEALETVAEAEKDVVIELTDVTVKLDAEAVKAVTEQAGGATIEIRAVKAETHTLTETQQAAIADKDTAIVVTAQIFSDGEYIGDFKGGKATIKLPFTPEEGKAGEDHSVYFIDDNGEVTKVPSEYVDGHMVFTTSHFSDYAIVYEGAALGGETETVVPEAPAAESSVPIIPIVVVIAIIVVGGVVLMMKKRNAED